jgi:hypothetical protein
MRKAIATLVIGLVGVAMSLDVPNPTGAILLAPIHTSVAVDVFEVVPFGDSITLNSADPNVPGPAYTTVLGDFLTQAGMTPHFTTVAHGSWNCNSLRAIVSQVPVDADLIIVDCGTNDTFVPTIDPSYNALMNDLLARAPGAMILPAWIQYSAKRTGLAGGEALVNDSIYRVLVNSAKGPQVFWPPADFQAIPEWYLDAGGIHPTVPGFQTMANIIYDRIKVKYGLPDLTTPLCGQVGDQRLPSPTYLPCTTEMAH